MECKSKAGGFKYKYRNIQQTFDTWTFYFQCTSWAKHYAPKHFTALFHLGFLTTLGGRKYYPHFTYEETGLQKLKYFTKVFHLVSGETQNWNQTSAWFQSLLSGPVCSLATGVDELETKSQSPRMALAHFSSGQQRREGASKGSERK